MPNSRRQRFSVHNGIADGDYCKVQTGLQTSDAETNHDIKLVANKLIAMKSKNRMQPNSSKNTTTLQIIADCESTTSMLTEKKNSNTTNDKDVTVSSSNIDLFDALNITDDLPNESKETIENIETPTKRARPLTRDNTPLRRENYLRQHRIKVRSPKRRAILGSQNKSQPNSNDINKCTIGTDPTGVVKEVEIYVDNSANVVETNEDKDRQNDYSLDDMSHICHDGDRLSPELELFISACTYRGTVAGEHVKCPERRLTESGKSRWEQCGTRASATDRDIKSIANKLVAMKSKNKMQPNCSNNTNTSQIIADCENTTSTLTEKKNSNTINDKDVNASSSNANLINIHNVTEDLETVEKIETQSKRARPLTRDNTPLRREKYLRQHHIKVRSPKRRAILGSQNKSQPNSNDIYKCTIGTDPTGVVKEVEIYVDNSANVTETNENEDRQSDHSLDDMCRICHGGDSLSAELGLLLSACACRGTVGRVHVKCLERWLTESGKSRCELCGTRYATRRVHRYGVPRALVMWILSQNAKQLLVDSLGIMLMSPLAVLAAWLSGRTLAGLMTQDSNGTPPWPLASTFVLACMTLVCYYCWIVSAATRHALGWWIWYRSQYEVRLTLENEE